jgi:hypothetical protein
VSGEAHDAVLAEAAEDLIAEALGEAAISNDTRRKRADDNGRWTE